MLFNWADSFFTLKRNAQLIAEKIDDKDQTFKFNQMITVLIGLHLPTSPHISD